MPTTDDRTPTDLDRAIGVPDTEPAAAALAASHRRGRTWAGAVVAVAAILVALLLYFGWVAPYFSASHDSSSPGGGSGGVPPVNQTLLGSNGCNAASSLTPSAVLMPLAAPSQPLPASGTLVVNYELAVVNFTPADRSVNLYIPSLIAVFPTSSGNSLEIVFAPAVVQPSAAGWESPSFATRSASTAAPVTFTTSPAYLTSSRLAIMSSVPYGQIALELRWHWSVGEPNGTSLVSNWTSPTAAVDWPSSLPSIFLPAPLVTIVQTSGTTGTIGQNYTVWLGGDTGGRNFTLELEQASTGTSIHRTTTPIAPGNLSSVPIQVTMLGLNGIMLPGAYLVHVHDSCGALLHSLSLNTIYAENATVSFQIQPASCGGVQFNNTTFVSGSNAVVTPGPNPFPFVLGLCGGANYTSISTVGGLHILNNNQLLVSSSGTLAVTYP